MLFGKKTLVAIIAGLFILAGIAATKPPEAPKYKNLKILPKNISKEDLDKVMDHFKTALGVKCSFCHAPSKDTAQKWPDFASDEKPEKLIARKMMKMTSKINKKFFSDNKNEQGVAVPAVECMTCHRGSPHPDEHK
ncbi:MAG TPA: c-type cytochrome [Puia sp.]|nr:c-type cytochrome [Puia sp.]